MGTFSFHKHRVKLNTGKSPVAVCQCKEDWDGGESPSLEPGRSDDSLRFCHGLSIT